jgi:hypothetical protein
MYKSARQGGSRTLAALGTLRCIRRCRARQSGHADDGLAPPPLTNCPSAHVSRVDRRLSRLAGPWHLDAGQERREQTDQRQVIAYVIHEIDARQIRDLAEERGTEAGDAEGGAEGDFASNAECAARIRSAGSDATTPLFDDDDDEEDASRSSGAATEPVRRADFCTHSHFPPARRPSPIPALSSSGMLPVKT